MIQPKPNRFSPQPALPLHAHTRATLVDRPPRSGARPVRAQRASHARRRLFLAVLLLSLASCARHAPPDVLVILIDTLRADRVGTTEGERLAPFLSSLARKGFFFRNAYAQSSWTNPSVATLLTSRYQSQHHITSFQAVLSPDEITLAEVLQQHGYATAGFVANILLRNNFGFGQGFDVYRVLLRNKPTPEGKPGFVKERAERLNREALKWLDELGGKPPRPPVFMYLHYMEPHNPYDPPDEYVDRVLAGRPRPDLDAVNERMNFPNLGNFTDDMVQAVKTFYDAEVISIDTALHALFDELAARHFLDNCIVVVVADHGEEFHEHGLMGHHQTLYEEVLRVPLIMLVPGQSTARTVEPVVSLTDVAPTVLDLAGLPAPATFEGGSLRAAMGLPRRSWWPFGGGPDLTPTGLPITGTAFSELIKEGTQRQRPHERAAITATHKLILDVDESREFYDLQADPGETNKQAVAPETQARLAGALADFMKHTGQQPAATAGAVDAETRERMRALGYHD